MRPGHQKKLVPVILATGDSARTEASPDLDDSAHMLGPLLSHSHLAQQRRELINSAEARSVARLTLLILMAQGAPGKPGRHVLKAEISLKGPRPQALIPATRNL